MKGALQTLKCSFVTEGESTGERTEDGNLLIDGVFPYKADVYSLSLCLLTFYSFNEVTLR